MYIYTNKLHTYYIYMQIHIYIYVYIYIRIYIYIYVHDMYLHTYIYIYNIHRERERETLHWVAHLPAEIAHLSRHPAAVAEIPFTRGAVAPWPGQRWQKILQKMGFSMGKILHKWEFEGEHPLFLMGFDKKLGTSSNYSWD